MTPQQIAEQVRDEMLLDDKATVWMGIEIVEVGPGHSLARMTVRKEMVNGHGLAHGGLITTLADSAFAFACNAYNEVSVASGFDVNLLASARAGDVLSALCTETSKSGRTGVYDVEVRNQHGERIAAFRGRSYTMKGRAIVEGLPVGKQRVEPS
jgi:acyl-CoA thioesterase